MWKKFTEKKENLSTTKRWQRVLARGTPSRPNTRDNQVQNHILSPKCSYQLTNGSGMIFLPSVTSVKDRCHGDSKIETKMLRHDGSHREDDEAIDWSALLPWLCRDFENENVGRWSNKEWLDLLQQGSDKKRFQYCLNSDGLTIHMRATQRHSGGKLTLHCWTLWKIQYRWSEYLCRVGCPHCTPFLNQD